LVAWLHGVARRVASKARITMVRRRSLQTHHSALNAPDAHADPLTQLSARELLSIVDCELQRLPQRYQSPLVLCCLEGHTQQEAAQILGWTAGSVKGRLERGRSMLHARLVRRGLTLGIALSA